MRGTPRGGVERDLMGEQDENRDRRSQRRVWRAAGYLALLAAGVLAAWQIHVFWQRRSQPEEAPLSVCKPDPLPTSQPAKPLDLAKLASDPVGQAGLKFLKADPGGLEAPKGAKFDCAIQRVLDGCLHRYLKYQYRGAAGEAASHYARTLEARGLALVRDGPPTDRPEERVLVFQSQREHVTVRLGKRAPRTGIILIGVTVMQLVQ